MFHWELLGCLLAALFSVSSGNEGWGYRDNGPAEWSLQYPQCGGNLQSPIALHRRNAKWNWPWLARIEDYNVQFLGYENAANGVFSNNGHSVNLALNYTDRSTSPRVVLTIDGTATTFYLTGLHFHWPSEHWVNDRQYPLEMHMVHSDPVKGGTLVLGYVFTRCYRSRAGMDFVAAAARHLLDVGDSVAVEGFAPQRVMPYAQLTCGYFTYTGSLTTPPCTEGVRWFVQETPLCLEDWQMDVFERVLDASGLPLEGNNRPLQARNNRKVEYLSCGL